MEITILGCGASTGVPMIGQEMPPEMRANPKNFRLRVSVHIQGNTSLLIDTSPDLRQQALQNNIKHLDAVLYTHTHADHIMGIDEIKAFNKLQNAPIDCYASEQSITELTKHFDYCFAAPRPEYGWYRPCMIPHIIKPMEKFKAGEFEVLPFLQKHTPKLSAGGTGMDTLGFRIGDFAYSTDVKSFPEESFPALENLDTWVIDCQSMTERPTHLCLADTLGYIEKFRPKRAILTHMGADMNYDKLQEILPQNIEPAYDGMRFKL